MNETVLEMHYHRPLLELVQNTIGLGAEGLQFYKYSPQREVFVGFDQAFVTSELTEEGFFLQFKVVNEMQARSKYTPSSITVRPYYRAALDTQKNQNTGFSQHELLYCLKNNPNALVFYACPMLFDRSELYKLDVDLSTLRLVDLLSAPSAYTDNDHHYIFFADPTSTPIWRSEPVEGRAISPNELIKKIAGIMDTQNAQESALNLYKCLTDLSELPVVKEATELKERETKSILPYVGDSLTILKITHKTQAESGRSGV